MAPAELELCDMCYLLYYMKEKLYIFFHYGSPGSIPCCCYNLHFNRGKINKVLSNWDLGFLEITSLVSFFGNICNKSYRCMKETLPQTMYCTKEHSRSKKDTNLQKMSSPFLHLNDVKTCFFVFVFFRVLNKIGTKSQRRTLYTEPQTMFTAETEDYAAEDGLSRWTNSSGDQYRHKKPFHSFPTSL